MLEEAKFCRRCELCRGRTNVVWGKGSVPADVMFLGEGPGKEEDKVGEPFVGQAGKLLDQIKAEVGLDRRAVYTTNVVKCRPPGNRAPSKAEVARCRRWLVEEIRVVKPKVIVCLGQTAFATLTGVKDSIKNRRGVVKRCSGMVALGASYLVTYHPAHVLRSKWSRRLVVDDLSEVNRFLERGSKESVDAKQDYVLIDTREKLQWAVSRLNHVERYAFDVETDGGSFVGGHVIGVSFSWQAGTGVYVPLFIRRGLIQSELCEYWGGDQDDVVKALKGVLENGVEKSAQNGKYDCVWLRSTLGIDPKNFTFDTMIAARLVNDTWEISLDALTEAYAPELIQYREALYKVVNKPVMEEYGYSTVPLEVLYKKACADVDATFRLVDEFRDKVNERMMWEYQMPLQDVLGRMEEIGVLVDVKMMGEVGEQYEKEIEEKKAAMAEMAPGVNVDSPKQLGQHLFVKLGLPSQGRTKTGYSVDEDALEKLAEMHPLPAAVLECRKLQKIKGTYVDGVMKRLPSDGRVHTSFSCTTAVTGRLSSRKPNMQNQPEKIRPAYIARPGCSILGGDYAQMELRILAWYSQDKIMLECFRVGEDIHRTTAVQLYGVLMEAVTEKQRATAKSLNFGMIYGGTIRGLAEALGVSVEEMGLIHKTYFHRFWKIKQWMDEVLATARRDGRVISVFGRVRNLPEIGSANDQVRARAERQAVNSLIQGTAADFCCYAMIRAHENLERVGCRARVILNVHDAIYTEFPDEERDDVKEIVQKAMTEPVFEIDVPMKVDFSEGKRWK